MAYAGEMNTKRLRENYLRAILRQDIAYFDDVGVRHPTLVSRTHLNVFSIRLEKLQPGYKQIRVSSPDII
jgi:hypothetical protein